MKNILLTCLLGGSMVGCTTTRSVDDHSTHYNGCKITNYNGDTTPKPQQQTSKPVEQTDKEYLQFLQEDTESSYSNNIPRPKPVRSQQRWSYNEAPQYPMTVFIPDEPRYNY